MKFDSIPALQVSNLQIIQGSVSAVDCERKNCTIRSNGTEIKKSYDYLVAASGLRRVFPVVPQSLTRDAYLLESEDQISAINASTEAIVVIGGGT